MGIEGEHPLAGRQQRVRSRGHRPETELCVPRFDLWRRAEGEGEARQDRAEALGLRRPQSRTRRLGSAPQIQPREPTDRSHQGDEDGPLRGDLRLREARSHDRETVVRDPALLGKGARWGLEPPRLRRGAWRSIGDVEGRGRPRARPRSSGREPQPETVVLGGVVHGQLQVDTIESGSDPGPEPDGQGHRGAGAFATIGRQRGGDLEGPRDVELLDARAMPPTDHGDREQPDRPLDRIEVVGVAAVALVLEEAEALVAPVAALDRQRAVVRRRDPKPGRSDGAPVVLVVRRRVAPRQPVATPAERRDLLRHPLDRPGSLLRQDPDPLRRVVNHDPCRRAVDGHPAAGQAGHRKGVDPETVVDDLGEGVAVHGEPDDVGPGMGGRVEDPHVQLVDPRDRALRTQTRQAGHDPRSGLVGELRRLVEAGPHLPVDAILRAPADRVVCLVGEKRPPGDAQRRALVGKSEHAAQRGPGLRPTDQCRLGGAIGQLQPETRRPNTRKQVGHAPPDELAGKPVLVADGADCSRRVVLEPSPSDGPTRLLLQRTGDCAGVGVGHRVVDAVEQQQLPRAGRDHLVAGPPEATDGGGQVVRQMRGGEVTLGEVAGHHARAVGRHPAVDGGQAVELVPVAPPVDEAVEPEAGKDLGKLRGVAKGVGRVGDPGDRSELLADPPPLEEVPDVGLAAGKQGVRLHVPGADRQTTGAAGGRQPLGLAGSDRQVVLDHDGLAVEHEAPARVGVDQVEHPVDRVHEPRPEGLEGPIPLAIPVRVRDDDTLHGCRSCPTRTRSAPPRPAPV